MLLVMSGRKQCATIDIANYTFSKKRDGMTNTTNQNLIYCLADSLDLRM